MGDEPLRYAVLIGKPDDLKVMEIARALAQYKKVPEQDLVPGARRCWGIIEDDVSEETARGMAAALEKSHLSALAVPRTLLEEPLKAVTAPLLPPFKPERLKLLAAAVFKQTTSRTVKSSEGPDPTERAIRMGITMITGIPTSLGGGSQREVHKMVENTELVYYLDLILDGPPERLRIDAQDFDFSCLGAKKGYSAGVNFHQLIFDLADKSRGASRNRGTVFLLEQKPVREMGYESLAHLDRECRWLLTLAALKRA